jgi:hypothetical protein
MSGKKSNYDSKYSDTLALQMLPSSTVENYLKAIYLGRPG